jgi:hypothetical protein
MSRCHHVLIYSGPAPGGFTLTCERCGQVRLVSPTGTVVAYRPTPSRAETSDRTSPGPERTADSSAQRFDRIADHGEHEGLSFLKPL